MNLFDSIFKRDSQSTTAVLYDHRAISYGELRTATEKVARVIRFLGIVPGDRVALLLNDSPEFIEAFIAICSSGAIAVPINMALRLETQRAILHNCGAQLAFIEEDLRTTLLTDVPDGLDFPEHIVVLDRAGTETKGEVGIKSGVLEEPRRQTSINVHSLDRLLRKIADTELPEFVSAAVAEPAFILYTSGSTGEPKGAVHRQADILFTNETFCREVLRVNREDRLFSSSRLPFAYGLGNSFTFPLLNGATTILCSEKPTPEIIASVFREYHPTIFFGVPVIYNLLLEYGRTHVLDCSSLRLCVSAGEALPGHLGQQWEESCGVKVLDGIGSTEMLHMFMSNHEDDVRYGSSGKILHGYEACLREPDGSVAEDEGNLWVKGASAAIGYWQRPTETAQTFVDGWVRTGDLYRRDRDGYWFHLGRSDDCFKSSGQWVSPVEVEGVISRHKAVAGVAVVQDFDSNRLPCPGAFVVSHDVEFDAAELEKELREFVAASLPRFKRPRKYIFVRELPYTATGKLQRFKLRQQLREREP